MSGRVLSKNTTQVGYLQRQWQCSHHNLILLPLTKYHSKSLPQPLASLAKQSLSNQAIESYAINSLLSLMVLQWATLLLVKVAQEH